MYYGSSKGSWGQGPLWHTGTRCKATEQEARAQGGAESAQCKGSAREAVLNPHPHPYILLYRA
jgi:hypothetical protein